MESPEPASPTVEAGDAVRVIRIMPDSRYALIAADWMSKDELMRLLGTMDDWLKSEAQFVILQGVKLVRLDGPAPEEGTSDPDGV